MFEASRWTDDPPCGHLVAHPYQTHYCSYIRVPKLLTLQSPQTPHPDETIALLIVQAIELWLQVILNDVKSALRGLASGVYQPTKLLHRAARLIRLLDLHTDVAESILLHDLGLLLPISGPLDDIRSAQLRELESVTEHLVRQQSLVALAPPAEASDQPMGRIGVGGIARQLKARLSESGRYEVHMTRVRDVTKLSNLITRIVSGSVRVAHASLFLWDKTHQCYVLRASHGRKRLTVKSRYILEEDHPLINWLRTHRRILSEDELAYDLDPAVRDELKRLGATLVAPGLMENHLVGFLALGFSAGTFDMRELAQADITSAAVSLASASPRGSRTHFSTGT